MRAGLDGGVEAVETAVLFTDSRTLANEAIHGLSAVKVLPDLTR